MRPRRPASGLDRGATEVPTSAGGRPKIAFSGRLLSVQPRIRLTRSYDEREHTYQGYVLKVEGKLGEEERTFLVGIGESAHARKELRVGDLVSGKAEPVADPDLETAELYRVAELLVVARGGEEKGQGPPWHGVAPGLSVYRLRGHRRLDPRTYEASCSTCIWGCRMAVEMILDQWKPDRRQYRTETFCYGPRSCRLYRAGPTRKVPGRKPEMVYEEADWVDEDDVGHRAEDE